MMGVELVVHRVRASMRDHVKHAWTLESFIFYNASVCCVKHSVHNYNVVL